MIGKKALLILIVLPPLIFVLIASFVEKTHNLKVKPYIAGEPVYSDRCYADQQSVIFPETLSIVPITRHFHYPIIIECNQNFEAYRFIALENDNGFVKGWEMFPEKIMVKGKSSTFNQVYKKTFSAGISQFEPGGPVAASPLLILTDGNTTAYYKTNYLFPEGIMAYKTKLLMFISLYINYCFFLFWLSYKAKQSAKNQ